MSANGGRSAERGHDAQREALRAALRAGDARAFETLFTRHAAHLQRVAYGIVRSRETAAELVQDVYLGLWNARTGLDVREDLGRYLVAATRNRALDWVAREALHRRWAESAHADDIPQGSVPAGEDEDTEHHRELRGALAAALADMPERQREVCRLRWQVGLGPTAIAAQLGIGVKTVETQLRRGLVSIRAKLRSPERA